MPAVAITNPGPDMKLPIPVIMSLPIPLPNSSNLPPSPKAPIALLTKPNTFSIAGFKVAPPIAAPALVRLAKVLFTRASRV